MEYRPLFTCKFPKSAEHLPVFNEVTDYADHVDDEVRRRYHADRRELLKCWHGGVEPQGVETTDFSYRSGEYLGTGRVYRPAGAVGQLPMLVYLHGGGWTSLCKECYDYECSTFAREGKCVVFSLDYRLAPEWKYPTYLEDCYAGLLEAVRLAERFGADASRLALGGDSAGGNIALALCLLTRRRAGPAPSLLLLFYPVTGPYFDTLPDGAPMLEFLPSAKLLEEAFVSPIRGDLRALPPGLLVVGSCDFLLEDNLIFAQAAHSAGVQLEVLLYDGMPHGFIQMVNPEGTDALRFACERLRECL